VTFLFTDVEGSTRRWEADTYATYSATRPTNHSPANAKP
jgi:class 3 adenylate cyclase